MINASGDVYNANVDLNATTDTELVTNKSVNLYKQ